MAIHCLPRYRPMWMGEFETRLTKELLEIGELARGGMGTAHLVMKRGDSDTLFVLKRLRRGLLGDVEALRRFRHETALSKSVRHPHIVRTMSAGTDERGPYLLLEYVHGTHLMDLSDRALLRRKQLSWKCVASVGLQAALGLGALHDATGENGEPLRILHRDLSPQNLLVEHTGRVVLSDFGISKSRLSTVSTDASHMLGKLAYMPPEYLRDSRFSPAGDVYALGVTLWVALTGQLPFRGGTETQLLQAIVTSGVPPARVVRPDTPPALSELLAAATAMDAGNRPRVFEFQVGLKEVCEREGTLGEPFQHVLYDVDRFAGSDLAIKRQVYRERARQLHEETRGN